MLQQVERFRPLVEHCRAECCTAVLSVGTALAAAVAPRYPGLCSTVAAVVEEVVSDAAEPASQQDTGAIVLYMRGFLR
jgi:hypothetical protein